MNTLVIDVMEKRLEKEINDVLKHLELHVGKIEFKFNNGLALVINLEATDTEANLVS